MYLYETYFMYSISPFHSQLTILQNAINNRYTLHDNLSDPHAETLSKLAWAAHMSHVLSLQNMYPSRDIFTIITKRLIFYSKLNFGDTNSCYRRKWNVSARRSGKKLLRGQIIIAKVTLERAPCHTLRISDIDGACHYVLPPVVCNNCCL